MGLYDRDYIRDDNPPGFFLGAQRSMVTTLIIINAAVFVVDLLSEGEISTFLAIKSDLFHKPWNAWQLLTAGFAHDPRDWRHIIFNMLYLWFFGRDVESVYGAKEFLRIYLTLIVVSSLVWLLAAITFHNADSMYGASGAVVGIMMLFVLHFPMRIVYLFGILPLRAWVLGSLCIAQNVLGLGETKDHVAYEAHLAGAAFAFIYYSTGWNLGRWLPSRFSFGALKPRPKLRVHEPDREESLSDQVDRILEKISREGEASLSAQERSTLEDASRRYQQRRR